MVHRPSGMADQPDGSPQGGVTASAQHKLRLARRRQKSLRQEAGAVPMGPCATPLKSGLLAFWASANRQSYIRHPHWHFGDAKTTPPRPLPTRLVAFRSRGWNDPTSARAKALPGPSLRGGAGSLCRNPISRFKSRDGAERRETSATGWHSFMQTGGLVSRAAALHLFRCRTQPRLAHPMLAEACRAEATRTTGPVWNPGGAFYFSKANLRSANRPFSTA
jgi:hypothetical protein